MTPPDTDAEGPSPPAPPAEPRAAEIARVCVVGAGAWGTVLALHCVRNGLQTTLLCRNAAEVTRLRLDGENRRFLRGVPLPETLAISADTAVLAATELVVLAVPAQRLRENLNRLAPFLPSQSALLCVGKGIELGTGLRMSEVVAQAMGQRSGACLTLSGPTLSGEIARGLPAASVVAGPRERGQDTRRVQSLLSSSRLRLYSSVDQVGVEIGGAMKNVVAIACGICDGLEYGHNARAGLITRGLAEVTRLAVASGGRARTIAGLAGLGDLVTTVASAASRNYALGVALGRGGSLAELTVASVHVAEGVHTARAALTLAGRLGVDLPITAQLAAVLDGVCTPEAGAEALMQRALAAE